MADKFTKEDFIKRSILLYGDVYDFSKTIYVDSMTELTITCPIHGDFVRIPNKFLHRGAKCPDCMTEERETLQRKKGLENFLTKSRRIHGDRYIYDSVHFEKGDKEVIIICREHGPFEQKPKDHMRGHGCQKCAQEKLADQFKMPLSEFVRRSKEIYKDRYQYDKVIYKNTKTQITLTCNYHKIDFPVTPEVHLNPDGCGGCPECAKDARRAALSYTTEEFITKARMVHGDLYNYSKVDYKKSDEKVWIGCKKHGLFDQIPATHLQGFGCRYCGYEKSASQKRYTLGEFIKLAQKVHGNKFDYSEVKYINSTTDVTIICKEHGRFSQTPAMHLSGNGCPKCAGRNMTLEEFLARARQVHGDKYDYSITQFNGTKKDIEYICPIHGSVTQKAESHLVSGCRYCAGNVPISREEFLKRAKQKFSNNIDYSRMNYKDYNTEVEFACIEHGKFYRSPLQLLSSKCGCTRCGRISALEWKRVTLQDFIERSKEIHGESYDYKLVPERMALSDTIDLICPKHGIFPIPARNHLYAKLGCPRCISKFKNRTIEDFLEEAQKIHGDRYDYSLVEFEFATDKINIICKKHGVFPQRLYCHLLGAGCPSCSNSRMEAKIRQALKKRSIKFETQKRFPWLVYKGSQALDFYLPDYNVAIECQGIQHFVASDFYGQDAFDEQVKRDENKFKLCSDHGIKVLYYSTKGEFVPDQYFDTIYHSIKSLIVAIDRKFANESPQ